jgi:hypothetical protein
MLTEFAFTPSIFDEDAHEDKEAWRDQLKELGRSLFPRVSAWPVVISDLYAGSWNQVANQTVQRIKDQRARLLCEGILQNMRKTLVNRPPCGDWPDEDIAWGREAIASDKAESIERIVANAATKAALLDEYNLIRSLEEVEEGGFWRGIASDASPKMIIADQVQLLRKLCLHSHWVALINAHTSTNESDFALELLQTAFNRPADFAVVKFELHTQEPQNCMDEADRQNRLRNVSSHVSRQVRSRLAASQSVDLYFWPKLLDRLVISGTYSVDSERKQRKSPRWGVSMNHVARGSEVNAAPTEWKLLRREQLDYWFRMYVSEDAVNKPTPINITPFT